MPQSPHPALQIGSESDHSVVIILHGLGADGEDLLPLAQALRPANPGVHFILPNAPLRHVTLNNGMLMPAWYDISGTDFAHEHAADGLDESLIALQRLMVEQAGAARRPLVLIGFSQGGALALHTALRTTERPAGVAALAAYLPPSDYAPADDLPVFMAHGLYDDVVPLPAASASKSALEKLGCRVQWREYAVGHQLAEPLLADLSAWLSKTLADARGAN